MIRESPKPNCLKLIMSGHLLSINVHILQKHARYLLTSQLYIVDRHGHEFNGRGISNDDIPNYVLEAVHQGNVVGTQGKRTPPRAIYEFTYNGETHRVAVQVGSNGYIVSANLKSTKEN